MTYSISVQGKFATKVTGVEVHQLADKIRDIVQAMDSLHCVDFSLIVAVEK